MRGFGVAIEVDPHEASGRVTMVRRLGKVERAARDFTPVLKQIRKSFYAGERSQFASLGHGDWAPDTARTLRRKARRGEDPRVMRATGALYTAMALGKGPDAIDEMTKDELTLGTGLKQAVVAQRIRGRRRRRVMVISRRRRSRWVQLIRDHILNATNSP